MKLAARTSKILPSPTLKISAKAKAMISQGVDVIDFSAGEPACGNPEFVNNAAEEAIREGFTKYTAVSGIDELKEAVIEKLKRDQGVQYERSQILISCGAKHTLYNIAQALFESGDEVIIPSPYWVSYPDQVRLADASPVFLKTEDSTNYAIDLQLLEACITTRTKAIILNSPCNPTGAIYSRNNLEGIAEVALRHGLTIISDEIYEKLLYDDHEHVSIASFSPEVSQHTVIVNGVSKAFAMTGWRIGYAAGSQELISAMTNIQSQSTSNPTSISQKAALVALQGGTDFFSQLLDDLRPQRKITVERLNTIPGVHCPLPAGAFYAFPNVSGLLGRQHPTGIISTPSDLASYLLQEAQIACVPGEPFGSDFHLRFSYTPTLEATQRGLDRLEAALHPLS